MVDPRSDAPSQALSVLLSHLRSKRAQLDAAIDALEKLGDMAESEVNQILQDDSPPSPPREVVPGMFAGLTISDAVKQLLLIRNRPLKNAEIIDGLVAGGHALTAVPGGAAAALSTALHRRVETTKDIVKLGRGVWALAKDTAKNRRQPG